jgi:hypothetical protein
MKDVKDQVCERADELISFLYGELGENDSRRFERHLHECAHCESEFAAFGQIRKSIVSWRDESLGSAWMPGAVDDHTLATPAARSATQIRPSALAAIREFFNLSPLWMKGAAAFASLLFCLFAALAIAHLIEKPKQPFAQSPDNGSAEQLTSRIAELQDELAKAKATQKQDQTAKVGPTNASPSQKPNRPNRLFAGSGSAANARNQRKPLTRQERDDLAADLGLLAARDDDDLDLVTDKINQAP